MISRKSWIVLIVLSCLSIFLWFKLSYPQLVFVDFSTDRAKALKIAKEYLRNQGVDTSQFKTAILFAFDNKAYRYLQKTIGFKNTKKFIKENDFDLFFWLIRFFKEEKKEEYRLAVSSSRGEIVSFKHIIKTTDKRKIIKKNEAREKVITFLERQFKFNPNLYTIHDESKKKFDNRVEYTFSWEKKSVHIPWSNDKDAGTGKLIIGATIAGDEIRSFSKNIFIVPEQFNRRLSRMDESNRNISVIIKLIYYALFTTAFVFFMIRRDHLCLQTTRKFYVGIASIFFLLSVASIANQYQSIIFDYKTTTPFNSYLIRYVVNNIVIAFFFTFSFIVPAFGGELLHFEVFRDRPQGSFLYYLRTTFFSRQVGKLIFMGYGVSLIMLGMQSLIITFGQKYMDVWVEHTLLTSLTSSYFPFLTAFTIGFQASLNEEIMFRLFSISLGKKALKNILATVVISSVVWGFAHTNYPVYPRWFRGIEVSLLGLFLSFIYLRFGIIPVIVGHYLFDVFWNSAEYFIGTTKSFYFIGALSLILLPGIIALIAFVINKPEDMKPMRWKLSKHQKYNLRILRTFLDVHKDEFKNMNKEDIKKEISSHGWDTAVVDMALELNHFPEEGDI